MHNENGDLGRRFHLLPRKQAAGQGQACVKRAFRLAPKVRSKQQPQVCARDRV
jgi:hypothetical protein